MASWTYAGEYLKNGYTIEMPVYEGAWTAVATLSTNLGDMIATTGNAQGYYAAPVAAGDFLQWYTADGTVQKLGAAADGKLLMGIAVDNPHGLAGGTRRVKVYMIAPGDILLCEFDITHTAVAIGDAIDSDAVVATALHGHTMNKTGVTGIGAAMDVLAINTVGFVRVRIVTVPGK